MFFSFGKRTKSPHLFLEKDAKAYFFAIKAAKDRPLQPSLSVFITGYSRSHPVKKELPLVGSPQF